MRIRSRRRFPGLRTSLAQGHSRVPPWCEAAERRERVAEALRSVGLGERLGHAPAELSGRQRQRVAIARALVKKPRGLLADEPTGDLDEGTRGDIMGLPEGLWQEYGLTFVLVTHESSIARRAPRPATIDAGRITLTEQAVAAPPVETGRAGRGAPPSYA
ncbi:ATP-binding cassette domain-containing protein [Streptomyces phaeoluteigriseus]|uniref:ATP-binding cassette domain-containing protein n=1 Tax=Streptomyces phaeoluteigriseus TaxID=114686 RepID=UPI00269E0301